VFWCSCELQALIQRVYLAFTYIFVLCLFIVQHKIHGSIAIAVIAS